MDGAAPGQALGVVIGPGAGLAGVRMAGETLAERAARVLRDADMAPAGASWPEVRDAGRFVVLHDAACPETPAEFLAECLTHSRVSGVVVVAVRPVTDTVKVVVDGFAGATVDRAELLAVVSPVVLPPEAAADLSELPEDLATAVGRLREAHPVELAAAPPDAARLTER